MFGSLIDWIKKIFGGIKKVEPPEKQYFFDLSMVKYEKGVLDCSNKAAAYLGCLRYLGIDSEYCSVKYKKINHGIVWYKINKSEYWADPTFGTYGDWGNSPYTVNGVRNIWDDDPEFDTKTISYEEWLENDKKIPYIKNN